MPSSIHVSATATELSDENLRQQLGVAALLQRSLLPNKRCCFTGREVRYQYEAKASPAETMLISFLLGTADFIQNPISMSEVEIIRELCREMTEEKVHFSIRQYSPSLRSFTGSTANSG